MSQAAAHAVGLRYVYDDGAGIRREMVRSVSIPDAKGA